MNTNAKNPSIAKGVDSLTIWLFFLIALIGVLSIFAVEYREGDNIVQNLLGLKKEYSKQLFYLGIYSILGVIILLTDSKIFTTMANLLYAFGIVLLFATFVPGLGRSVNGSHSWIALGGGFNLQPAEFCKIFTLLALAKYISRIETHFDQFRSQVIAAGIIVLPALITIGQNETGLALVYFSLFIPMYREGLPPSVLIVGFALGVLAVMTLVLEKYVLLAVLTCVAVLSIILLRKQFKRNRNLLSVIIASWLVASAVSVFVVPYVFDNVLQEYQARRIYSLVGKDYVRHRGAHTTATPSEEELKHRHQVAAQSTDYNVKQSKIAIGSGGVLGKGYLKGTQTRYDFVPEQSTDFIFCTIGEDFGFAGCVVLLGLYLLLLWHIVNIAERQRSVFSRVYAYGVASIIFFHIAVNVCMTIGLAPVIGIPLPLMSYGGSSLLTFTILIFVMIRLDADRHIILR
ncbi:rod shape-determining protein RodA [Dinghuibacter silviterrae]|uniref:Cell wall polymerase n=1 Tax=Dinghuibacter silviterrae TaxID=1539049 RepID=A0A4R8DQP0_9BACT|nr:rod shape-determining protein RodA [Dinghuibacter silviterrae]TDX00116.1 rod shape determining protein RodA [Dinghuibacter silviterrae]